MAELKDMTLAELGEIADEVNRRETEAEQAAWERTRWQTAILLAPYAPKGKNIKPKDLAVFPWEKTEAAKVDPEKERRIKELGDRWDAEMKKRHGG